jgi:hypothetical protein
MCRSIRTLRVSDRPATTGEAEAAALQYVRKISGFRAPSARNQPAFDEAVHAIANATERLLQSLGTAVAEGPDPWRDPDYRRAIIAARPARSDPARRGPARGRPSS